MIPLLVRRGHEVVGLDTDFYAGCDFQRPPDPVPMLDADVSDDVSIVELVGAVHSLLDGCPGTPTPTGTTTPTASPTPTVTVNLPPDLPRPPVYRTYPDFAVAVPLFLDDPNGDQVVCSSDSLPDGAAISEQGRFEWMPNADQLGPFYVPYRCTDDAIPPNSADGELIRTAHRTIDRVSDDILRRFQFHTPIAALFELVNETYRVKDDPARAGEVWFATETVLSLIQPYAPHVAEELWERLGHERLREEPWPVADAALVAAETVEVVVQVNGKLRDRIEVDAGIDEAGAEAAALASPKVAEALGGATPKKVIARPPKLVNIVV